MGDVISVSRTGSSGIFRNFKSLIMSKKLIEWTEKLRKQFYQDLLQAVCEDPDTSYGFCHYITKVTRNSDVYPYLFGYHLEWVKEDLPELYKAMNPDSWKGKFMFPTTKKGWQQRINMLVDVINQMK